MTPVLKATGISVRFGGVHAVVGVDLEVGDGRLVGLIGPNGAGKTTFIDAISGFVRSEGRVELDGNDLSRVAPHVRARRGLARTWQSIELFDDLTMRREPRGRVSPAFGLADDSRDADPAAVGVGRDRVGARAARPRGGRRPLPGELSQGQRKLAGIARALVVKPRVVCLDEPAAGLDTNESEELGARLRGLADGGQSMLLVDHDMGLVLGICDEVVVLEFGKVIARGAPDAVRRDPRVIAAYLGSAARRAEPARRRTSMAEPVLTLEGLTAGYDEAAVIRDVDLTVRGRRGGRPARSERRRARRRRSASISGLVKPMAGRILFADTDLARTSPSARARMGIAHVPEGRGPLLRADRRRALSPRLSRRASSIRTSRTSTSRS